MAPSHAAMTAVPVAPDTDLKLFQPSNAYVALGLAVSHLMTKPAFAKLRFGDWSRILTGQINRKHYCFAIDGNNQVQGFLGWALTSKDKAEAWVEGRGAVSFGDSQDGDCVILNAWAASTPEANRFLLAQARRIIDGKDTVYFKRHYKDGSTRPVRLRVNDFVARHLGRAERATPRAERARSVATDQPSLRSA
jgi:hemolysin-activating ACP:hemolysin acyltransferase